MHAAFPAQVFRSIAEALIARLTGYAGEQVFMLSADAILNIDTLSELLASGHSRVPVHVPGNRYAPKSPRTPPPPLPPLTSPTLVHVAYVWLLCHLRQPVSTAALHSHMALPILVAHSQQSDS